MSRLTKMLTCLLLLLLFLAAVVPVAYAQEGTGAISADRAPRRAEPPVLPADRMADLSLDIDAVGQDLPDTDGLNETVTEADLAASLAADAVNGGAIPQSTEDADGVLPATVFDPDETSWSSVRNMSSAAFSAHFNAMKDDYLMIDIEVDEIDGQERVAAVWQWNSDNRGWAEWRNLTHEQFSDKWSEYADAGYRLIDQEAYLLNGSRYYAGIWVENKEGYGWASYRNLTSEQFSEKFNEFKNDYIIIDVEAYPTADGLRYAMVWVRNAANLDWVEWRNLTSEQFGEKFDQYKEDYRVWDIESYRANGVQYYAGIWIENSNNRGWAEYRDMSATGFRNRWYRLRDLGYRLVDYEIYPSASGYRYAGVWRQNSERPNWSLKDAVDARVQTELDTFGVPGIGVAIAQNGEIKYMRGFGSQDADAGVWYSARTINRLASVAKAVTGVLAVKLQGDGVINDLDNATSTFVGTLPGHHTHDLRQLLANRGGVGHYADHGTPNGTYNSALEASQAFWNDPLPYAPGTNCIYSTHGYTIVGAALESATGEPVEDILLNEISTPYGLPTLRVEDLNVADYNRSRVYDDAGNEATPDNIYWKAYGGGEEASAYDLVRFGMKVLDDTILSEVERTELWSVPAPTPCIGLDGRNQSGYALGWDTGTDQGTQVVAKGGNQLGANTYIRMYPEHDIVIVVLANRDGGGHSTPQLGRDIGTLMLNELAEADSPATPYMLNGLAHYVLGAAQAFRNTLGQLIVSDFDASGDSGLSVGLNGARVWTAELDLGLRVMRSDTTMSFDAYASNRRAPSASLTLRRTESGLQLEPAFESGKFEIQWLMDETEAAVPANSAHPFMPWDEIWCIMDLPPGQPSELCRIWISYHQNSAGQGEWNLILPSAISVPDADGSSVQANRVRLVEVDASQATAADGEDLATLRLTGANLAALTLVDEQAGGLELAPVAPATPAAESSGTIFLPIVTR
jgi:CubicO group peptidase (beta-lactamase class C family)